MSLFTRNAPSVPDDGAGDGPGEGTEDGTGESTGDRTGAIDGADEKTVRIARKRFTRRQWARRWLAWRRIVVGVLLLGLVGAGTWLVFFSSVLAVAGVQVEGTKLVSPSAVRRAAAVPLGSPLATADLDAVTARVQRLVAVKSVDVSRAWPDQVRIDVTERRAVAVVEPRDGSGQLRGIDATGVDFRGYRTRPKGLPVLRGDAGTDTDALAEAATVAGSLPPALAAKVAYVEVRTVDHISLELRSGPTVLWGSAADSVNKARVLGVLLGQHARYYDVSVPGQPVIRK
jgi:cell division protein FtsQ